MTFLGTVIAFMPFIIILLLANLADRQRQKGLSGSELAALSYLMLILIYGVFILLGLTFHIIGWAAQGGLLSELEMDREFMLVLGRVGIAFWIPSLFGIILLLRPLRRLAAGVIPIDPASTVHAISLSFSMLVIVNLLVTLGIGLANLINVLEESGFGTTDEAAALWAQAVAFVLMAMVGVGWLSRRSLSETLQRLGIIMPTMLQVILGLIVGIGMALVILPTLTLAEEAGLINEEVNRLTELLVGPLTQSPFGILSLGLAAGIGEEALLRGALQPRFGIPLTTLLFALLHSQYGLSLATLVVFVLGFVLAIMRQRTNTSTAIICHASYNITTVILTILSGM